MIIGKQKSKLFVIILAVSVVTQVIYSPSILAQEQDSTYELELLQQEIDERNSKLDAPNDSLKKYQYDFSNEKPKLSKLDISIGKEFDENSVKKKITKKNARNEVNWLFRLLRSRYGLYTYFGGDERFEKAQEDILKELAGKGKIKTKDYEKLLYRFLNFIEDKHFVIGDTQYSPDVLLFSNEEVDFCKKEEGFYKNSDTTKKIITIQEESPENYLKRAIDQEGKLTYYLYAMDKKADSLELVVNYEDNTSENIILKPAKFAYKNEIDKIYGYNMFNDNIPIMELNMMVFNGGQYEEARDRFLEDVEKIKEKPNLIIDLRNNHGGDGTLVQDWFKLYTEQKLQPNYSTLRIAPSKNWFVSEEEYDELFVKREGMEKREGYYWGYPEKQFIKGNDTRIFLLTSRSTGSAAEAFTDALHNLDNTVVIGTNTSGVFINMANYTIALPYSRLRMQFGECLMYYPEGYFQEGYGFEPDIYLTGEDLETRLEKFFEYYVSK